MPVMLLLLTVGDFLVLLSMARGRSGPTSYEPFVRRRNRHCYMLLETNSRPAASKSGRFAELVIVPAGTAKRRATRPKQPLWLAAGGLVLILGAIKYRTIPCEAL